MEDLKQPFIGTNITNKNEVATNDNPKYIRESLDSSDQGVKRLFALAYNNVEKQCK